MEEASFSELHPIPHGTPYGVCVVATLCRYSLTLNSECFAKCAVCCLIGNNKENNKYMYVYIFQYILFVPARRTYREYISL